MSALYESDAEEAGLRDVGVAVFPSLPSAAGLANLDIDGDVDHFLRKVCTASDYARRMLRGRRAALYFPNVAAAPSPVASREGDGVLRLGATTVAYYHLIAPPYGRRASAYGLVILLPDRSPEDWRDYRIPFGQQGLVAKLGLEGARLLRIRHPH
jgi:hypothetical protein